MQYTDDSMLRRDLRILQPAHGYRFTLDAVLLATFIKTKPSDAILEIGAGTGVVSNLMAPANAYRSLAAVEIQTELALLCCKNFENNQMKNAVVYEQDIKNINRLFDRESFDLIYCNPPYRKTGTGRLNPSEEKAIARHEIKMKLHDVFECADRFLKPVGDLALVLPVFRENDFQYLAERFQFHLRKRRYVHSFANQSPAFFLATICKRNGPFTDLPALVIYDNPGEYTKEMENLLHG
jgi:tRNA1Val (adenine37-N6)-methyltransferase